MLHLVTGAELDQRRAPYPELQLELQAGPAATVRDLLGGKYSCYLRILHPFTTAPIRWRQRTGAAQITSSTRAESLREATEESLPCAGMLDVATSRVLSRVLFAHPAKRDAIVAFETGKPVPGNLVEAREDADLCRFEHNGRSHFRMSGTLYMVPYLKAASPSHIWPLSGTWALATEPGGYASFLGCSEQIMQQLGAMEALELRQVSGLDALPSVTSLIA